MTVRYLGMNSQTGLSISEVEHIRQSVRDILVTPVGSRVMRREYGSLLSQMIDQPQTPALRLQIMAACYSAIQKWEPRVNLSTITFERSEIRADKKGTFTVDEIEHRGAPDTLTIRGRSADFRGTLNSRREQSWHDTTLGQIVETIAARNKLTASVADTLKAVAVPHIDQSQESDAVFLSRLAERNGASVSVKAGKLLFLKAGSGKTASGKPIPQMTLERGDGDRHQFAIADREAYTGVTAKWLHTKDPKPQKQKVKLKRKPKEKHLRALQHPKATKAPGKAKAKKEQEAREGEYMAGEADNVLELTTIYATKAQAMRAAQAKWDKLQRGVAEFSILLAIGRADLFPETPIAVKGFKRVIDDQAWIISRVVHNLNSNGYTTGLELEVRVLDVEYESEELTQ
ncbi:contractile injection system protein, VgrG/Pvc8 family [Enterobacter asburiae]